MDKSYAFLPPPDWEIQVSQALKEDMGPGDLSGSLIAPDQPAQAFVTLREGAVLCGSPWFEGVFRQLDSGAEVHWLAQEGQWLEPGTRVARMQGRARALLSGERTALNFLQTLSGVATQTRRFVLAIAGYSAQIVDTRKTIPGLRLAEKYAVRVGGGHNHRMGLYDAILIKENHIAAAGGLEQAYQRACAAGQKGQFIQLEVETLEQLQHALDLGVPMILLDNMSTSQHVQAVQMTQGRALLEVSGGVSLDTVRTIAATGVDRISIGALTKDVRAIDYSMRIESV